VTLLQDFLQKSNASLAHYLATSTGLVTQGFSNSIEYMKSFAFTHMEKHIFIQRSFYSFFGKKLRILKRCFSTSQHCYEFTVPTTSDKTGKT